MKNIPAFASTTLVVGTVGSCFVVAALWTAFCPGPVPLDVSNGTPFARPAEARQKTGLTPQQVAEAMGGGEADDITLQP